MVGISTQRRGTSDGAQLRRGVELACVSSPTILPDAYVEIVINLGGAVALEGPPITGSQPARAVVVFSMPRSKCGIQRICGCSAFGSILRAPRRSLASQHGR